MGELQCDLRGAEMESFTFPPIPHSDHRHMKHRDQRRALYVMSSILKSILGSQWGDPRVVVRRD